MSSSSSEQSEVKQPPQPERGCTEFARNQSEERQFDFEMDGGSTTGTKEKDKMQCLQVNSGHKGQNGFVIRLMLSVAPFL